MELTKNNMQPFAADYTKVRSADKAPIRCVCTKVCNLE